MRILESGGKSWMFVFTLNKKSREMSLGPYPDISLERARDIAAEMRKLLREGIDPIERRRAERAVRKVEIARGVTFREAAEAYIALNRPGWKNDKHAAQRESTLATYAHPVIGDLPCASISTDLVKKVLTSIRNEKPETASRLRGRIQAVLASWATNQDLRGYSNPATWTDHLEKIMPSRGDVQKVQHHAALPLDQLGEFMRDLRQRDGTAARALELTILTAARTGEVIGMRWDEIDLQKGIWTIPCDRMKARKEHWVPLSHRAKEILLQQQKERQEGDIFVFQGDKPGRPLSNMSMLALLKRMDRDDLTVHGMRFLFRDWAGEKTNFPREVIEHAMAHQLTDKAEAAYQHGTLFSKRENLMQTWASYIEKVWLATNQNKVVDLRPQAEVANTAT